MEEEIGALLREWSPLTELINQIPLKVQMGLFSKYISITCIDVIPEFLALGTNIGALFWYNRKHGQFEKFKCETNSEITCIKIVSTVDYMIACGHDNGQISIFQIPKTYPDSLPDCLKTQCTRKLERYTVTEIHSSSITTVEWSTNGMKLFSGDKTGLVVLTELDFSMHICKEMEIVNESYEIVQLSYCNQYLLISTTYRTVICCRQNNIWKVCQVGKKDRKTLGNYGGIFIKSGFKTTDILVYCCRPGLRLWVADINGSVQRTLLFKDLITTSVPEIQLLNPISNNLRQINHDNHEHMFGKLLYFHNKYLITYESNIIYILDPENLIVIGIINRVRKVLSVACYGDEMFVLEGGRSLIRIAFNPETAVFTEENATTIPTATLFLPISNSIKDFTNKLQSTNILTAIPTLLEHNPLNECSIETDTTSIVHAEEALETPNSPNKLRLKYSNETNNTEQTTTSHYVDKIMSNSTNFAQMVASLISNGSNQPVDKSNYVSKYESPRHVPVKVDIGYVENSEECLRKLELFDKIGEENFDNDILFKHSRRKKSKKDSSEQNTDTRMASSCYIDNSENSKQLQPLNISMIDLPQQPDLRSPDSIQNDIKTKEKLLSDVLYYTKPVELDDDTDKLENDNKKSTTNISYISSRSNENGCIKKLSPSKSKPPERKVEMPVWVQAQPAPLPIQLPLQSPSTSTGTTLLQRLKNHKKNKKSNRNSAPAKTYQNSYNPDDYLGPSPNFGFLTPLDLTDESDISLTEWEIL